MKRRYLHQPKQQSRRRAVLTLADGIPTLRRTISETGPSIPSDKEHKPASFAEAPFGLIPEDAWNHMLPAQVPSRLHTSPSGELIYSSENDVAAFVKSYVSAVVEAIGLGDAVELHSEIGTFNVRPDLWVVSVTGVSVGVIEVKKPDVAGKPSAMSHPNVLGELYDFLKHLSNFYGVSPCFGVLTNMNNWRFAWLPDDIADSVAADEEHLSDSDVPVADEYEEEDDAVEEQEMPHGLIEDKEDPNEDTCDELDTSTRSLRVSPIFDKSDTSTLGRAIIAAILKMLRADPQPFSTPFDRLSERTILKFTKGGEKAVFWTRLKVKPRWDCIAKPKKFLFAIEDLGRGADGRVWLTSSSTGAVCVLKFALSDKLSDTMAEAAAWKRVYPGIPVKAEIWCGHPALQMPYFCPKLDDKNKALALVKKCLSTKFAARGMIHEDVQWRNIGFFKHGKSYSAIVFDLASVRDMREDEDNTWVHSACELLASN